MILTLLFSAGLFFALWPYFIFLGVLDFKRNQTVMEKPLSDRPARRTIGRKNEDIIKVLSAILFFHFVLYGAFYGMVEMKNLLTHSILLIILGVLGAVMFYSVIVANRLGNAYLSIGQLSVIHFICSFVAFSTLSLFIYDNHVSIERMYIIAALVLGAMLMFSKGLEARR